MPEENLIAPVQVIVKKPKRKAAKKKRTAKSPFKLSNDLSVRPVMPKTNFKIKADAPAKKAEVKSLYGKLAASFVVLTLMLVAAVLYFMFSQATIVIIPTQEKIADSLNFEIINQAASSAALGTGQISGAVKQVPVEQTKTFNSSGKEVLGEEVTGRVVIINNYLKNQPLVATTRLLSSDNKLFRLANTVNVPAGGRVIAEVYADQAKPEMAIGPGKFTIPGLWAGLQDKIYAQSEQAMNYREKTKYTIKQSDIDNAVAELKNSLLDYVKNQVGQAYQNYSQALYAVDNNSVSQEVSGKVGEEKQQFGIKMKTMVTVVAFNDQEIFEQAKAKLAASLADDRKVAQFSKSDMAFSLTEINSAQGLAAVKVDFSGKATLKDNANIIKKSNLAGLSLPELQTYLNSLPEVAGYEINFFPSFVKKVPKLADRIKIVIKK